MKRRELIFNRIVLVLSLPMALFLIITGVGQLGEGDWVMVANDSIGALAWLVNFVFYEWTPVNSKGRIVVIEEIDGISWYSDVK